MNWLITLHKQSHLETKQVLVSAKNVHYAVKALMAEYPEYSSADKITICPSEIINFNPDDE
jgi:hypothetical protein